MAQICNFGLLKFNNPRGSRKVNLRVYEQRNWFESELTYGFVILSTQS